MIEIPGNPGDGSVNAAYKPGTRRGKGGKVHATLVKTERGTSFQDRVVLFGRSAKNADPVNAAIIRSAPTLGVTITVYWGRKRNLPKTQDLGLGDWDAVIKGLCDPLQDKYGKGKRKKPGAGIFDDDVRITDAVVRKRYDKDNQRIVVEVYPMEQPTSTEVD